MFVSEMRGHVVIVMGPMGSGKGSLVSHVRATYPQVTHTVSCTTRSKRPQEEEGVNYFFITREEFESKVQKGEFMEWAEFGGNLYGTLKSELNTRLERGEVVICEIDVQGVLQLLRYIPEEFRTVVYIDGGDWDQLKQRALARAPISEAELALRHERFLEELAHKGLADVMIHNREGELAAAQTHIEVIVNNIITNKVHA